MFNAPSTVATPEMVSGCVNVTVALCLLCAVLEGFDIQAMGVAAPRLLPEFGLSPSQMGWVFFSFILAYAIFEIPTARWADRRTPLFVRRRAERSMSAIRTYAIIAE